MRAELQILCGRYQLEERIGQGAFGTVYRAIDRLNERAVAVKRLRTAPREDGRATNTTQRTTIAEEFRASAGLRHPNIISVLDYGFDSAGNPVVVMELLPSAQTILEATRNASRPERLEKVRQLLRALEYLRRNGIVHRDIKPSNVLVEGRQVKLVDFGISLDTRSRAPSPGIIYGTYGYLAPEVFQGEPVGFASDVYSAGVLVYEVLTGNHPYSDPDSLEDIIDAPPRVLPRIQAPEGEIVAQMMALDPRERPTPAAVLSQFADLAGSPDDDSASIRDSYLRGARFVGRSAELSALTSSLHAATLGKSTTWLIAGPSGIGKSRLMAEFRVRALVDGFSILEASCAQESPVIYGIWRTLSKQLRLLTQDQGSTDVDLLWPVGEASFSTPIEWHDDGARAGLRSRLLAGVKSLLAKLPGKSLILLEDIQWADEESLWLLQQLLPLPEGPVVICAAYRSDEMPGLSELLRDCRVLTINRLAVAEIRELSRYILGAEATNDSLVEYLDRETDGNAFFVVETLQALATESGSFETLSVKPPRDQAPLPQSIREVMMRRLARIGSEDRAILNAAAAYGRNIDQTALQGLFEAKAIENALMTASAVAIVENDHDVWRFCHDRMREAFLDDLAADARASVHKRWADVLVRRHRSGPGIAAKVAAHFGLAGNVELEARYALEAGREAFTLGAYHEAVAWLEKAASIPKSDSVQNAQVRRELAEALIGMGRMEEARLNLQHAARELSERAGSARSRAPGSPKLQFLERSRVYERLAHTRFFDNDVGGVLDATIREYWFARKADSPAESARACANLAGCLDLGVANPIARALRGRAHAYASMATDPSALGWVYQIDGVSAAGHGNWETAARCLREAERIWTELANERRRQESRTLLGMVLFHAGRRDEALALRHETYELGLTGGNHQAQAWGLLGFAEDSLRNGDPADAAEYLRRVEALPNAMGRAEIVWAAGLTAHVTALTGGTRAARASVAYALSVAKGTLPSAFYALDGYSGICVAAGIVDTPEGSMTRAALRQLMLFALAFPIGRPRFLQHCGHAAKQSHPRAASVLFERAAKTAARLRMEHDVRACRVAVEGAERARAHLTPRASDRLPQPRAQAPPTSGPPKDPT